MSRHDDRVQFLETLAALTGCDQAAGGTLPDGRLPDVLRMDSERGILFIGDAKDTETPGSASTQARLLSYLRWVATHVNRRLGLGIFAICFGREGEADRWVQTVLRLGKEIDLCFSEYGVERFDRQLLVAWFLAVRGGSST